MSCYEWERGTIKLPSAETVRVKKAVREAVNKHYDDVLRLSKECYATVKAAGKRGANDAIQTWGYRTVRRGAGWGGGSSYTSQESMGDAYDEARQIVMSVCNLRSWSGQKTTEIRLRTPTAADVTKHLGERATNRTNTFRVGWEATISFNGNEVEWSVGENNHACDSAHEHFVGKAFWNAIGNVKWTRGTGGVIIGNDEYNRDSGGEYEGGGGSYAKSRLGPVGEASFKASMKGVWR